MKRMKIPKLSAVSIAVLVLSVLVLLGAAYAVWAKESTRPGREIVTAAEQQLAQAQAQAASIAQMRVLPDVDLSWTKTLFMFGACGVSMQPIPESETQGTAAAHFTGPQTAWRARLNGNAMAVFACLLQATEDYPVLIDSVTLRDTAATVEISIIGQLTPPKL